MKNLIFLFTVLFTFQNAKAQFQIGVETNSSWSNMNIQGDGNLLSNPKLYNGIKTGISVAYPIYAGLGVESGLYYHRTGFKVSQALDFDVYNFPIKAGVTAIPQFHYLETPLLLNYTFGDKIQGTIGFGPYVGFALDGEIKTRANFLVDFNLGKYDLNLRNDIFPTDSFGNVDNTQIVNNIIEKSENVWIDLHLSHWNSKIGGWVFPVSSCIYLPQYYVRVFHR